MTVDQLREALASMPGHWPVHVEVHTNIAGEISSFGTRELYFTLDCIRDSVPTSGNQATIRINYEPT